MLRSLPTVLLPMVGEALYSWVEAMAARYRSSIGDIIHVLDPAEETTSPSAPTILKTWTSGLAPRQLETFARVTGLSRAQLQGTTRAALPGTARDRRREATGRGDRDWRGAKGLFCPACLSENGGRWALVWESRYSAVCPQHHIHLSHSCPRCHRAPRTRPTPLSHVPDPGKCALPIEGSRRRCGGDLTSSQSQLPVSATAATAQDMLHRAVIHGRMDTTLYADAHPSAGELFTDLALLTRCGRNAAAVHAQGVTRSTEARGRVEIEANALLTAYTALQRPETLPALLSGRVGPHHALTGHSPQLQRAISQALGRRRRATTILRAHTSSPHRKPARAARVPALLWPTWVSDYAPRLAGSEREASALAVAVVLARTPFTHRVAQSLLGDTRTQPHTTHVLRKLAATADGARVLSAIDLLARTLDSEAPPIDYARRRRLDYAALLPRNAWAAICAQTGVSPGGDRRWHLARLQLYTQLTGNSSRAASFPLVPAATPRALEEAAGSMPPQVAQLLHAHAEEFLAALDIREPVHWAPPRVNPIPEPVTTGRVWRQQQPAVAAININQAINAYRARRSLADIGSEQSTSRQTITRALAQAGVPLRGPGRAARPLDSDWLRTAYVDERHSIAQLAAESGRSRSSIALDLKRAGITVRPRGPGARPPQVGLSSLDSRLLRRVFAGQGALQRVHRFLVTAEHPTMTSAAQHIGCSQGTLSGQLSRLASDVGGDLFRPAERGRPQNLTPLGKRLQRELNRILVPNDNTSPDGSDG